MLDPVGLADHVETHGPRLNDVPGLIGERNAGVGEDGVDPTRHGREHVLQNLSSRLSVCFLDPSGCGEVARRVNADERDELAFGSPNLGEVDRKKAWGERLNVDLFGLSPSTSGKREMPCPLRRAQNKKFTPIS